MKKSCESCMFFDGNHACLHPIHTKNVNPWHECDDFKGLWEDV